MLSSAAPSCLPDKHCMLPASPEQHDAEDALVESIDLCGIPLTTSREP